MAHQFAALGASTPARLRLVFWDRGGLALGVLQHGVNLWPSQKARTQRLIRNVLRQPLDDPRRLPKRRVRLLRLASCLIHPYQRRLDLPPLSRQPNVCCQPCCLAQGADASLSLSLPYGKPRGGPHEGNAEALLGTNIFPHS